MQQTTIALMSRKARNKQQAVWSQEGPPHYLRVKKKAKNLVLEKKVSGYRTCSQ